MRTSRGDWRWLASSARCAEREGNDPVRVYCVARDITDRRETQRALVESLSLFDQSFENAPIGMAIAEPGTGRYLRVNDALCRLLGRSEHELMALESDITGDGTFQTEKRYVRPDGSKLWCSLHVMRLSSPSRVGPWSTTCEMSSQFSPISTSGPTTQ